MPSQQRAFSRLQNEALQPTWIRFALLALAASLLSGCAARMMPPPHLYTTGELPLFGELAPELQTPPIEVLYVTDRAREGDGTGPVEYGYERSSSAAYGSAVIEVGQDLTWEEVEEFSTTPSSRAFGPKVRVATVTELGRLPATPYLYRVTASGELELDPEVAAEVAESNAKGKTELQARLASTPKKEVFVFVHGVGNSFDDAILNAGEAWHFLGREGVPIAYTWPAGRGGLLFYAYDRESGEFTIFHLKQLLELLASTPEVEKVHLVAHSRGTDVVMTALRELVIQADAAGQDPRQVFKIEDVILIAPDLDFGVVMQRMVAEALGPAVGRFTVYANADDDAMSAAIALFGSRLRLGSLRRSKLSNQQRDTLEALANLDIISYQGGTGGKFGHSYFRENPAVSSDILARLRYGWLPGEGLRSQLGRVESSNFWIIDDDYLSTPPTPAQ